MRLGLSLKLPGLTAWGGYPVPYLFQNGEQGFWYDPSDVNLAWRRNLLTYTEQFDDAAWTKGNATVTANSVLAPNGTTTADTLTGDGVSKQHYVLQGSSVTGIRTISVYAKAGTHSIIQILTAGSANPVANFDLVNGTANMVGASSTASIQDAGDGWYRCVLSSTDATATNVYFALVTSLSAGRFQANTISGSVFLWGAQLEVGSLTPYQRIVTPEITYVQDVQPLPILYQDAAGTTPVTAVEQPCSLMLDKRLGLTLGSELVTNGDFATDSDWTKGTDWTIGSGVATKTAGTAANLTQTISSTSTRWYRCTATVTRTAGTLTVSVGTSGTTAVFNASGTYTFYILAGSSTQTLTYAADSSFAGTLDNVSVRELPGNHAYTPAAASTARPTVSARVNLYLGTATLATQNVTTVATNYTLRFEGTGSVTLSGTATGTYSAGTHTITCTAGTLTTTVTGTVTNADIRPANDGVGLPVYQRVTTASDYDTVGFPVYLRADGSNDYLLTNSIDFTGTDKMTLCAGVRQTATTTTTGQIYELSTDVGNSNGAIGLASPASSDINAVRAQQRGTTFVGFNVTINSPWTRVLTQTVDISGDQSILRENGTQAGSSTSDLGTGNFGNYPLYLLSRAGTSLFFNGRFYGSVGRGAQSNDQQIAALEGYMNTKTAAY